MAEFWEPQPRTPAKRAHWSRGCHHHVHQRHLASMGRLRGQSSRPFYPAASPRAQKMGTGYLAHPQTHKTHLDPRLGAGRLRCDLTCPCPGSCAGQVPVPRGPRSGVSAGKGLPLAPPQGGARAPLTHRGEARLGASSGPENSSPSGIAGPCHQSGSLGSSSPGTGMLGRDPGLWSWFPAAGQSLSLSPVPNLGCPYTLWPAVSPNVLRDTSWGRRPVCGWPQWPSTGFFPPCGWSWKPAGRNDLPWEAGH